MMSEDEKTENIQLELPFEVFCSLLRERKLVAARVRYLNKQSSQAGWLAVKLSLSR